MTDKDLDIELLRDLALAGVDSELLARVKGALAGRRYRQKTSMPAGWIPRAEDIQALLDLGWWTFDIEDEIQSFRDHASSHASKYSDWDAAFRNWMRSPYQKKGPAGDKRSVLGAQRRLEARTGGDASKYKPGTEGPGGLDTPADARGVRGISKR